MSRRGNDQKVDNDDDDYIYAIEEEEEEFEDDDDDYLANYLSERGPDCDRIIPLDVLFRMTI